MNNRDLYKSFSFDLFQFQKFHTVDNTKRHGVSTHYIGKMICGSGNLKTKHTTLHLHEGDVFYIPKGLKYQSCWYSGTQNCVSWYSFGFDAFPSNETYSFPLQKIECNEKSSKLLDAICEDFSVTCSSVGLLYQLIDEISKSMKKHYHPYNATTDKALEFMRNTTDFTMKDVAIYCGISESGLYPIFQKVFQKTPLEMKQEILALE